MLRGRRWMSAKRSPERRTSLTACPICGERCCVRLTAQRSHTIRSTIIAWRTEYPRQGVSALPQTSYWRTAATGSSRFARRVAVWTTITTGIQPAKSDRAYNSRDERNQETRVASRKRSHVDHQPRRAGRVSGREHAPHEGRNPLTVLVAQTRKRDVNGSVDWIDRVRIVLVLRLLDDRDPLIAAYSRSAPSSSGQPE